MDPTTISIALAIKWFGWVGGILASCAGAIWASVKGLNALKAKLIDSQVNEVRSEVREVRNELKQVSDKVDSIESIQVAMLESIKNNNEMTMLHIEGLKTSMESMKELVLSKHADTARRLEDAESVQRKMLTDFVQTALTRSVNQNVTVGSNNQ